MWFLTTPGGFANFVSEKPEDVAKREAMEEAGLKIQAPVFERQNFNRANISTLVRVGYGIFERPVTLVMPSGSEIFVGKMAVRIDKFRTTDAIVGAAVQFAREDLGLISSSPVKGD